MKPAQSHNCAAGFTLAEIMVAMAILGFIGLLTYGAFGNSLKARDRALQVAQRYHEIQQGLNRFTREISMAFLSHHRDCDDRRTYTIFKEESSGGSDSLVFTSFSHIKMRQDANESDQNELTYEIQNDPDDNSVQSLVRREANRIDEDPEEGGQFWVLIRDVESLEIDYYNDRDDDWEDDWDSESADYKNRLPMFVKITLKANGPKGKVETFVTKTEIMMHQPGSLDDGLFILGAGFTKCLD